MPPARLRTRQNSTSALQRLNAPGDRTQRPISLRSREPLPLPGVYVAQPSLLHQILHLTAILNRLLNVRRQFLRHVDRKSPVPSIPRQGIAAVSYTRCTSRALLPNTGALPQRNGTHGNRPEPLDGIQEPAFDLFRRFVFGHCIGAILHPYKPFFKVFVSPFSAKRMLTKCIDRAP